jgi:hypothetical protein
LLQLVNNGTLYALALLPGLVVKASIAAASVSLFLVGCSGTFGSTLVLDTFTEGEFRLSPEDPKTASLITGPIGTTRDAAISGRLATQDTILESTLSTVAGQLSFFVDGVSRIDPRRLDLCLSYVLGGSYNLLGYNAFEFEFSSLSGVGFIIVELGRASDLYGSEVPRVRVDSAGTLTFPFEALAFGTAGSVESFEGLHITFEAESEQFSFTLDEIRIVPEPNLLGLAMLGVGGRSSRGGAALARCGVRVHRLHRIRIALADVDDAQWDSGLFIESASVRTVEPQP